MKGDVVWVVIVGLDLEEPDLVSASVFEKQEDALAFAKGIDSAKVGFVVVE